MPETGIQSGSISAQLVEVGAEEVGKNKRGEAPSSEHLQMATVIIFLHQAITNS